MANADWEMLNKVIEHGGELNLRRRQLDQQQQAEMDRVALQREEQSGRQNQYVAQQQHWKNMEDAAKNKSSVKTSWTSRGQKITKDGFATKEDLESYPVDVDERGRKKMHVVADSEGKVTVSSEYDSADISGDEETRNKVSELIAKQISIAGLGKPASHPKVLKPGETLNDESGKLGENPIKPKPATVTKKEEVLPLYRYENGLRQPWMQTNETGQVSQRMGTNITTSTTSPLPDNVPAPSLMSNTNGVSPTPGIGQGAGVSDMMKRGVDGPQIDSRDVAHLNANPSPARIAAFEKIYGAGTARRYLQQ